MLHMHVPVRPAESYHEQMRNFCFVIRGTEKPVLSGRDGTTTLATTLAITESARRGKPVRVEEMLAQSKK
jgi:predicted dehydrogenase